MEILRGYAVGTSYCQYLCKLLISRRISRGATDGKGSLDGATPDGSSDLFSNGYANRSTALVPRSYWKPLIVLARSISRLRDVRRHVICDLDCGLVTVCRLLLEGGPGGGCRASGLGPRTRCGSRGRRTLLAERLRDACRAARSDARLATQARRVGFGTRLLPFTARPRRVTHAHGLERARARDLRALRGGAGGPSAASKLGSRGFAAFLLGLDGLFCSAPPLSIFNQACEKLSLNLRWLSGLPPFFISYDLFLKSPYL